MKESGRSNWRDCLWLIWIPLVLLLYPVKEPLFDRSYSTVLFDRDGRWIQGEIAEDEQWRFPPGDVPERFKTALITFEDRRFYQHRGVRIASLIRATVQNIQANEIVSGGSTLTMQTIRLAREKNRTYYQKIIEIFLALKWELHLSKEEILQLYTAHAPFGGNIVGLEAASYRYFGIAPTDLSWAESSLLAVLPNAPSLMYPGKNAIPLKEKRNRLLQELYLQGSIDETTLELALQEPLPQSLYSFPREAPHLMLRAIDEGKRGQRIVTTIDSDLQERAGEVLERHHKRLSQNSIENGACIILDTRSGEVLAYIGNTVGEDLNRYSRQVDNISASRSTGSVLKPFLYGSMIGEGLLMPRQLIPDFPLQYRGFKPENYNHSYQGVVPANLALSQSLNVPMVYLLDTYGVEKFHNRLQQLNLNLPQSGAHYGLTLIVGGAETSLWNLSALYAGMGRTLLEYTENFRYQQNGYHKNQWVLEYTTAVQEIDDYPPLSAGSIWCTLEELKEVVRPDEESGWIRFDSSYPMAWKTGTSWGMRDSWSIGVTPEYVIGVWVGNSSGEGRPGNTGSKTAAPVLFELANILPATTWFDTPYDDLKWSEICVESGMLTTANCNESKMAWVPQSPSSGLSCPYHKMIHLDEQEEYQVDSRYYPVNKMVHRSWFVLPPVEEWYYQYFHSNYRKLPPWLPEISDLTPQESLDWIYPKENSKVLIPVEIDGDQGKVVLQAAHRDSNAELHWFLDGDYLTTTTNFHQVELSPDRGEHRITISDNQGNSKITGFIVE